MDILKQKIPLAIYNRLIEANFNSLDSIVIANDVALCQSTKLSMEEIEYVVQEAVSILIANKITPAVEIPEWQRITCGCSIIDSVIRGGMPINGIIEIVGASGVGKTQLCLQLALTVQFPSSLGGLDKGAVYICTEDTFPSKRLNSLAAKFPQRFSQLNTCNFQDNIFIEHTADYEQLRRCLLIKLPQLLRQRPIGIIIIDSIAGIFRSETVGVNYTSRSEEFVTIATKLHNLQNQFNTAILCVNQVTCNTETGKTEPCLGLAWSNMVTTRFQISRNEFNNVRLFSVEFAPDLPNNGCNFIVNDFGILGVK